MASPKMPPVSRFDGMNPFIESQLWEDFHTLLIGALRTWLMPHLGARYYAQAEARVYIEHQHDVQPIVADVAMLPTTGSRTARSQPSAAPYMIPLSMPTEVTERFVTIRLRDSREVVTIIEILSPPTKRAGSDGRREYLARRDTILRSTTHVVEVDLLRGGERLPMAEPLPRADYFVIVSGVSRRPIGEVWAWSMTETLPTVSIPLSGDDLDVPLDMQALLQDVFLRAGYERMLDYTRPLRPPAQAEEMAWLEERLR